MGRGRKAIVHDLHIYRWQTIVRRIESVFQRFVGLGLVPMLPERITTGDECLHSGRDDGVFEMPRSKVPTGYIRVHVMDHGEMYEDPARICRDGPMQHPEFPEKVRDVLRRQLEVFGSSLWITTLDKWEEGFRHDAHPWREIAYWDRMAAAFGHFTAHIRGDDETSKAKRDDVFAAIQSLTRNGPPAKGKKVAYNACDTMTAKRVVELASWLFARDAADARLVYFLRRLIKPDRDYGPDRLPIAAIFADGVKLNRDAGFDPRDMIEDADIILAEDVDSGETRFVYGEEFAAEALASGGSREGKVFQVEIDFDTDDVEKLVALVQVHKGKLDSKE